MNLRVCDAKVTSICPVEKRSSQSRALMHAMELWTKNFRAANGKILGKYQYLQIVSTRIF